MAIFQLSAVEHINHDPLCEVGGPNMCLGKQIALSCQPRWAICDTEAEINQLHTSLARGGLLQSTEMLFCKIEKDFL